MDKDRVMEKHEIRLGEFDDIETANTWGIKEILERVKQTAPSGARVSYEYPGYISINLVSGIEIAFGESLEKDTGYSWNDFDSEGYNHNADSFEDLKDIEAIVNKLWEQTAQVTKEAK
jgi:hypothetical protein